MLPELYLFLFHSSIILKSTYLQTLLVIKLLEKTGAQKNFINRNKTYTKLEYACP